MALSDLKRWNLTTDKTIHDYTTHPIIQVVNLETTNDFMKYALNDNMWKHFQNSSLTDDSQKPLSALQNVFVRATNITFPGFTCDVTEIPQQFSNIKIQSKVSFTNEITINFVEDSANNIFKFFKSWLDQVLLVDYSSDVYGAQYNIANNYKINITFGIYKIDSTLMNTIKDATQYSGTNSFSGNNLIFEVKFHGFFPKSINNPTYDYTTYDIVTRDVVFTFDYIEMLTPSLT